ncbi:MAG: hypothetical protein KDB70_19715 [Mycobacterium sp.]|jgi:hypothetical protein|nr:hypothetical protein [Mycobacterium sp.]
MNLMDQTLALRIATAVIAGRFPDAGLIAEPGPRGTVVIRPEIAADTVAETGAAVYLAADTIADGLAFERLHHYGTDAELTGVVLDGTAATTELIRAVVRVVAAEVTGGEGLSATLEDAHRLARGRKAPGAVWPAA